MQNDWVVNVLADLKAFAQSNGLDRLAEHLDDTMMVAVAEISKSTGHKLDGTRDHVEEPRAARLVSGASQNT